MKTRFFLRIFLGVMAANHYAYAQVENVMQSELSSSTTGDGEEMLTQQTEGQPGHATTRDPFWPVGYVPAVEVPRPLSEPVADVDETGGHVDFSGLTKEEQAVIKSKMIVGGILQQGNTCLAIINQQLVKEGEGLSLDSGSKTYHFGVKKLTPDKILLESIQEE